MRWSALAIILLVAGCGQPAGPPLDDRGQLPEDIDAPPPEEYGEEVEFDPPGTPAIRGRVLSNGAAVGGARVWVEEVDIREQVDNVAAYEEARNTYLTTTDRTGAFQLRLDGSLYHIAIEARGHHMLRTSQIEPGLDGEVMLFHLVPHGPAVIAHRGASFYAPENTVPALWKARWLGATHVEVDIRLTADGHLVVFHDPWVNRTTDGEGMVRHLRLEQIRALDAGSWFHDSFAGTRVPTLQEVLDAAQEAGLPLVLDIKAPEDRRAATWRATLDAVAAAEAQHRVVFAVFREAGVQACAARAGMTCAWLRQDTIGYDDLPAAAQSLGAHWLMVDHTLVDESLVEAARARGLQLHAWTANHPDEWRPLLERGIDGITTDRMGYLVDDLNGIPFDAP